VDATIIHASSSNKNSTGKRDPETHQTWEGNQWNFDQKAHISVDSKKGIVHSACTSAACVADKCMLPNLLYGEERNVWGDSYYQDRETRFVQVRKTCRRASPTQEPNQVVSQRKGRVSIPGAKTHLRLRQG
jgi:IS5 family transposase